MILSYNWVTEFVAIGALSAEELAHALTMRGVEVESVRKTAPELTGAVTASILSVAKHPNADRLSLCEVSTGSERLSIVCGASNMKAGDKVALALHGAVLPGGQKIKKGKIRGVESQGMLMSEVEMGIALESSGIMILPPDTAEGIDVVTALGLNDYKLDIGITPNRPDLLSVRGMAREISAVTGSELTEKGITVEETGEDIATFVAVTNRAPKLCSRYMARVVSNIKIAPSPEWLKRRLEAHGLRPINNVVDITNYVLLELGQPLHAFDLACIEGGSIIVREATAGEKIVAIDNKERALEPGMLVIADPKGPLAIAGVMGGRSSEVTNDTKSVLIESALFDPATIRKTSRNFSLSTDSSYRFERGVDVRGVEDALDRATALISELAGGITARGRIDVYTEKIAPIEVAYSAKNASRILGVEVTRESSIEIFKRLGMKVSNSKGGDTVAVSPPSYRLDIKQEIDLVEEVARFIGYDKIPATTPLARFFDGAVNSRKELKSDIKRIASTMGFYEAINLGFSSQKSFDIFSGKGVEPIKIKNPLSEDQTLLRSSLLPGLLENLKRNLTNRSEDVRLFEISPVFSVGLESKVIERWSLTIVMSGLREVKSWNRSAEPIDFFDIKGVLILLMESLGFKAHELTVDTSENALYMPGTRATLKAGSEPIAVFGALHPAILRQVEIETPVYAIELDMEALARHLTGTRRYKTFSRFPQSSRDIAFIVDKDIPNRNIISAIKELETKLIEKVELFDVYSDKNFPAGKLSLAISVTYRADDRTLTHEEIDKIHGRVSDELQKRFGAQIRV